MLINHTIIDKIAVFFFIVMAFFIPMSNAVLESCFGAILFCFILKIFFIKIPLQRVKIFLKNRVNLSLITFFIFVGFSLFASGPLLEKIFDSIINQD